MTMKCFRAAPARPTLFSISSTLIERSVDKRSSSPAGKILSSLPCFFLSVFSSFGGGFGAAQSGKQDLSANREQRAQQERTLVPFVHEGKQPLAINHWYALSRHPFLCVSTRILHTV